jgi:hypothetical protein
VASKGAAVHRRRASVWQGGKTNPISLYEEDRLFGAPLTLRTDIAGLNPSFLHTG